MRLIVAYLIPIIAHAEDCPLTSQKCLEAYNLRAISNNCEGDYQFAEVCREPTSDLSIAFLIAFIAVIMTREDKTIPPHVMARLQQAGIPVPEPVRKAQDYTIIKGKVSFVSTKKEKDVANVNRPQASQAPIVSESNPSVARTAGIPGGQRMGPIGASNANLSNPSRSISNEPTRTNIEQGFRTAGYSDNLQVSPSILPPKRLLARNPKSFSSLDLKKYMPGEENDPQQPKITIWKIVSDVFKSRCRAQKILNCPPRGKGA